MAEDTAARKIDVPSELRVISCRVVNLKSDAIKTRIAGVDQAITINGLRTHIWKLRHCRLI